MAYGKRNFGETVSVDRSDDSPGHGALQNRPKRQKVNGGKPAQKRLIDIDGSIKKMLPEDTVQSAIKALYESTEKSNKKRTQKLRIDDDEINTDNISYFVKLTWTTPPKKDNLRPTALYVVHFFHFLFCSPGYVQNLMSEKKPNY